MEEIKQPEQVFDYENTKTWYCIKTQNRKEEAVLEALEQRRESMGIQDQLFRVVIPYITEQVVKDDKVSEVKKKMFPGYVFVEMKMDNYSWFVVRNTKYVHGFIGSHGHGSKPTPVLQDDILKVLRRSGDMEAPTNLTEGQKVRIINGPFEGNVSTIKSIINGIAKVTINMFDRETDLDINLVDLEEV